jgi:hypothetical protein
MGCLAYNVYIVLKLILKDEQILNYFVYTCTRKH